MTEKFIYLGLLLMMIAGMVTVDYRLKIAFFADWRRAAKTVTSSMVLFIAWDLFGIGLHIFYPNGSRYVLDIMLAPKFPIEELFFLFSLSYLTLLLWNLWEQHADVSHS